jgi:probable selenium-dependent hydroxylase accessory protein YqeC
VRVTEQDTLVGALGLGRHESVALVGGGGKTSAIRLLARELTATGSRVIVATTTAMFLWELAAVGPVVMDADDEVLIVGLRKALAEGRMAGAGRSLGKGDKVAGLSPATVDRVWAEGLADFLLVEADGSRGRPLKAFADHEPQVPAGTTTIVDVAGLDAVGRPLISEYVHRADVYAAASGTALGSVVTVRVFADGVRAQVRRLRRAWGASRIVSLLNKADGRAGRALGLEVSEDLLGDEHGPDDRSPAGGRERPDAVVIASVREGYFAGVSAER